MHIETNHVYRVFLRIMSQGLCVCVDHDYGHKYIYHPRAETQDKDKKLQLLVFGFALECRDPTLLRGDQWIS